MQIMRVALMFFCMFGIASQLQAYSRPYGRAGCGLGSIVVGPSGNQSSATTTNGLVPYGQLFAISSGTSNCVADGSRWSALENQHQYVANNLRSLAKEIAHGEGSSLIGYSQTFGCGTDAYPIFAQDLQKSYRVIFAAPGVDGVLDETIRVMHENPQLVNACHNLYKA